MTGPQRGRLVLALGGVNIVLAAVAMGVAGPGVSPGGVMTDRSQPMSFRA